MINDLISWFQHFECWETLTHPSGWKHQSVYLFNYGFTEWHFRLTTNHKGVVFHNSKTMGTLYSDRLRISKECTGRDREILLMLVNRFQVMSDIAAIPKHWRYSPPSVASYSNEEFEQLLEGLRY